MSQNTAPPTEGKARSRNALACDRWRKRNRAAINAQAREYRANIRRQVFGHYGERCACCGTTGNLSIDHIDGSGGRHRLELFGKKSDIPSTPFHRWLIEQGFPEGYQTLCRPCNSSKASGPACRLAHGADESQVAA